MFAHKILEDINKSTSLFLDTSNPNEEQKKFYKKLTNSFFKQIPIAHTFYFKEVFDLLRLNAPYKNLDQVYKRDRLYIKLPYKTTVFMWDVFRPTRIRMAFLLQQEEKDISIRIAVYNSILSHFYIQPAILVIRSKEPIFYIDPLTIEENGSEHGARHGSQKVFSQLLAATISLLKLLHCKNIVHKTIKPDKKLNSKRAKRKKFPLLEYKILELTLPSQKKSSGVSSKTRTTRLHFCRGHFKERKTGLFWWQPHIRGNKKQGVIMKDYKITHGNC